MAEIVRPVGRVVHVGVDADRDVELDAFRVQRVIAAVAGGNHVVQRGYPQRAEAAFLHQPHQFAHAAHAVMRADRGEADESGFGYCARISAMIALPARSTPTSTPARSISATKSAIDMP